ncbi:MAG: hypothetical protein IKI09_09530 [Bacteroidales bacterium]|nr:hypothetical protein [Bacteroidales bacterium]
MRKSAIFAAAFVLTLGLAQCKKEQTNAQISEGETVHITLNVNNNGSRADVNTSTGQITFNDNDKLYVGYDNAYVGTLAYSASTSKFSGEINLTQSGDQPLHFYYLGGGAATQVGEMQQYTVDISDQRENYPVISYGTSTQNYSASLKSYTTTLLNQCALVEFTTNEIPTTTAVSISGMKNKLTVDFNGNTLTPSSEGTGSIKLHAESATSRWAILLANEEEVESTASAEGYDATGITIPAINNNDYWTQTNGKNISFTMTATPAGPVTYTELVGGEVLHVGDMLNVPDGQSWSINEVYFFESGWSPLTVLRANIIDEYGEPQVVEAENGAYYVIKDNDGYYYFSNKSLPVTATSDGIYVTYDGVDHLEYTFTIHEP